MNLSQRALRRKDIKEYEASTKIDTDESRKQQFKKVGVLGHIEGGTIGLILAAEGKVDFVVSLAGGVISFEETLLDQSDIPNDQHNPYYYC